MISASSLAAFSSPVAPRAPAEPTLTARAQNAAASQQAPAQAPNGPPGLPGGRLPRGSLLNLSV